MKVSTCAILAAVAANTASAFMVQPSASFGRVTPRFVVTDETAKAVEPEAPKENKEEEKPAPPAPVAPAASATPMAAVSSEPVAKSVIPAAEGLKKKKIEPRYKDLEYSITLPFFKRPPKLDGTFAGDYGFDPMGFTEEYDLYYLQECELRHARLAMLAVVGWPMSELLAPNFMLQDGRAPSVLNGVNPLTGVSILLALAAFGTFEWATSLRRTAGTKLGEKHREDMALIWDNGVPGDYNFDPAGFYTLLGDDAYGRKALRNVEITQGRYAMLGITYFALWEAISEKPIVANNPFFQPNAILPLLAVAYGVWSFLYEVSDTRKFPIKIQKSKLGREIDEWIALQKKD